MSKTITIEDGRYEVGFGIGAWAKSKEKKTVQKGDVRVIAKVLMHAWSIQNCYGKNNVWWVPVYENENSPDDLRKWINNL